MKKYRKFWITELVILVLAAFFGFVLLGYTVTALLLVGLAVLIGLYQLIAVCCKDRPGTAKCLRFALSFLVLLAFIAFAYFEQPIIQNAHTDKDGEADYAIVLGAGVNGDVPSLSLKNRLDAALEYAEEYPQSKLIVSGGQGPRENISEAECMRRWLEERGVEAERIIMEDKASSTEENLKFSQEIIEAQGGDPKGRVAIVTAEYHLCRAKTMAEELGMEPVGVAAHTTNPVLMVNYFIREALAMAAYTLL